MSIYLSVKASNPKLEKLLEFIGTLDLKPVEAQELLRRAQFWIELGWQGAWDYLPNLPAPVVSLKVEEAAVFGQERPNISS
jgi:hypothetical protein